MSTIDFKSVNSVQGTITTITSTPLGTNMYAYNTIWVVYQVIVI